MATKANWKNAERVVARRLGAQRSPNTGGATADVMTDRFAIEVKQTRSLPAWFLDACAQAKRNATTNRLPVVVFHQAATKNYYAVMSLEVLEQLAQEVRPATLS